MLVLLVVGATDDRLVSRHKRTKSFGLVGYQILLGFLDGKQLLTTPFFLTEASNLLANRTRSRSGDSDSTTLLLGLAALIRTELVEQAVPSVQIVDKREFPHLGISDTAALLVLPMTANIVLLTSDLDLHIAALGRGVLSQNFNELLDQAIS